MKAQHVGFFPLRKGRVCFALKSPLYKAQGAKA